MKKLFLAIIVSVFLLSALAAAKPTVSVRINGAQAIPGDPISATPRIEITATTTSGPVSGTVEIAATRATLTFTQVGNNYYATREITSALSDGIYTVTVEATDTTTTETIYTVTPLYVQNTKELIVQGSLLCYPNPFDPGSTATTTIAYSLSKPANLTLSIYDLAGTPVTRKSYSAGDNGGHAGYNSPTWDGRSDTGSVAGNGIYVILLVADGKLAGKGKLTVLKR
jgi:hypothetical protein